MSQDYPENLNIDEYKEVTHSIVIDEHLYEQIDRTVKILQKLDHTGPGNKRKWILSAIQEKIENYSDEDSIPKQKHLNFKITDQLNKAIEKRVQFIQKVSPLTYSKKKWILEAIVEKLGKDKKRAEELLTKYRNSN